MRASTAWPMFILGIALMSLSGATWLVYAAHSDPSFAVEPDYYSKAVRWDETAHQAQENKRLGWQVSIARMTAESVSVRVLDKDNNPIDDADVVAVAFASVRSAERSELRFVHEGDGTYSAPLLRQHGGLWRFRLAATRGGDTVTSEFDAELSRSLATEATP